MSATAPRPPVRPPVELSDELRELAGTRTARVLEQRLERSPSSRRGWLVRRMLLAADLIGLALAFFAAELLFGHPGGEVSRTAEYLLFLATLPAWMVGAKLYGLYDNDEERTDHSTVDEVVTLFHFVTVGTWLLFAITWFSFIAIPSPQKLAIFWLLAIVLIGIGRTGARALARRTSAYQQNAVIVGSGEVAQTVARKLLKHPEYGINFLGFVDFEPEPLGTDLADFPMLGRVEETASIIDEFDVERVIVAFPATSDGETLELVYSLKDLDIQVDLVPHLYEFIAPGVSIHTVEGVPLIGLPALRLSNSSALLKRTMDVTLAAFGLILAAPFFALAALAIKLDSRGPIFFRQVRRGGKGSTFKLLKFRTMVADADQRKDEFAHLNKHAREGGDTRMFKIAGDPRVTRVGRVLRRTMLDELPQLWNVLTGDMSLVGPRPLILEEDRYVGGWARKRLDLKPGMTGLWQVLGRQEIPFEEMVKLDYLYVTTWSLGHDFRLLLRTIPLVLKGSGGTY